MGQRKTIILSLTLSFLVSTLAALSHEFYLLLASRAATGVLVGSNYGITNIYWSHIASTCKIKNLGLFLASLCFSLGAGYTSIMAYFILDLIGWRLFFIISSLPLFIFPLLAFIFILKDLKSVIEFDTNPEIQRNQTSKTEVSELNDEMSDKPERVPSSQYRENISRSLQCLIFQLALTYLVNIAQGWGLILFVPTVYNNQNEVMDSNPNDCHAIFGYQFLKLTLISGLGPLGAKILAYLVQMFLPLSFLMFGSSIVSTTSFLVLALVHWNVSAGAIVDVIMGIIKAAFAFLNLTLWLYMMSAFEGPTRTTATVIIDGCSKIGAILGSTAVAFLPIETVVVFMCCLGVPQSLVLAWLHFSKMADGCSDLKREDF